MGFTLSDRKTDCLLMNFFVLREEFFRQLVCLIDKEGCAYHRIGSDCNLWQCGEREKKTQKNINSHSNWQANSLEPKLWYQWMGWVISQIGGLAILWCLFICHFPSTGSGQVFVCEKRLIGQWTVTAEQNYRKVLDIDSTGFVSSSSSKYQHNIVLNFH